MNKTIMCALAGGLLIGSIAFVLAPPTQEVVIKTLATGGLLDREITDIRLMGSTEKIEWKRSAGALTIHLPKTLPGRIVNGFRVLSK